MLADERGSVINLTDGSASTLNVNRYDEYGAPGPGNSDLFQYTGQTYLAPGLYHYRARAYAPQLGRFLQTDPIGYAAGVNLYGYVGGDPVNLIDPFGLQDYQLDEVVVTGNRQKRVRPARGNPGHFPYYNEPLKYREPQEGPEHVYEVSADTQCPAAETFDNLRDPGMSAPGAPRAQEGFRSGIILYGNNPISQRVDSKSLTITNYTESSHRYYPGAVEIRVTPLDSRSSRVTIRGTGTTGRALENSLLGAAFFQSTVERAAIRCTPVVGD